MRSIACICSGMASLAFLSACWGHVPVARCNDGDYSCHRDSWQPIAVHPAAKVTRGAIDSVITVHVDGRKRITVFYGLDNPCQDTVTAMMRHSGDTLDIAFILNGPRIIVNPIDSVPDIPACPAAIMHEVYGVTVDHSEYGVHVVRGFLNDSTTLLATRGIPNP